MSLFYRRPGIVNVRMVITEEKILSNIDKIQKLINPNSKKQIVQLDDDAYFKEITGKIIKTRERSKKQLAELGFTFADSMSNFLFVTHPDYSAKELYEMLKEQHIFVRYFGTGRTKDYLRITIGTEEQMETLYAALRAYFQR